MNAKDLLKTGYRPGPQIGDMLAMIADLQTRGIISRKYILKLLKREFGDPPPQFEMREKPAPCTEAIRAETKEEKTNLTKVRAKMAELLRAPIISGGSIMPDACPAGPAPADTPVGGVIAVENAIIPAAHSADICCSMFATFYEPRTCVAAELDALTTSTRFGPGGRHYDDLVDHPVLHEDIWENPFLKSLKDRAIIHLADQGDGNHFAFIGELEITDQIATQLQAAGHNLFPTFRGKLRALITHHGSRSLGSHLYKRGLDAAIKQTAKRADRIPQEAAWLDANSPAGQDYWQALQYVSRWTRANHETIHARFLDRIGAAPIETIGNEHNFVWKRGSTYFHGKGATPAWKDDQGRPLLGLIPLNMAEPILLVLGNDNPKFHSFAPHGAGRNLSRTALMRQHRGTDHRRHLIEHQSRNIDLRWFNGKPDLSETPLAYKNPESIKAQIKEFNLATIVAEIKPLGTIMAGGKKRRSEENEEELTPKQIRQMSHRKNRRREKQNLRHQL
ncbi:MAG: RNA-splicing ligase RtcB [Akkermansiaceae bacterium]|jgi:RNA-splicing ligase RtcB